MIARGVDRRRIFVDDDDYRTYVRLLGVVARRQGWNILCYCLMPNHVHVLIETPEPNLANGMQWLQARYARAFNDRYARTGHLFETRYKSPLVNTQDEFVRTLGYIVVNPVDAVLSPNARDWPWGSHATIAGGGRPTWLAHERALELLDSATGLDCYDALVDARESALSRSAPRVNRAAAAA